MHRISIILFVVLFLAVGSLYFITFSAKDNQSELSTKKNKLITDDKIDFSKLPEGRFAFVDLDSISLNYQYINDQSKSLKSRYDALNGQYENLVVAFQEEYRRFQESVNAGIAPQSQLEAKQVDLQKKQNEIAQKENQIKNLEMEMEKVKAETMERVNAFIGHYNQNFNYDFIFCRTSLVNTIAFANPKLDITVEVLKGLNNEYAESIKIKK